MHTLQPNLITKTHIWQRSVLFFETWFKIANYFIDSPIEVKQSLLSSIFPEKVEFDGKSFCTTKMNAVFSLIYNETKQLRKINEDNPFELSSSVGSTVIFSHQFLEDLEKLWAMREWIPDPTKPIPPNRIQD